MGISKEYENMARKVQEYADQKQPDGIADIGTAD